MVKKIHQNCQYLMDKNNISVEEIADLKNLCFTKRFINSKKYIKSESIFIF